MATAIAHQRNILKIQKLVKVLSYTLEQYKKKNYIEASNAFF